MKTFCPDCGHRVVHYADECPKCACWLDVESTLYLRSTVFLIYVLSFWWVMWVLNDGGDTASSQQSSGTTAPSAEQLPPPKP